MTTSGKLSIPSMKGRCSEAEWNARVDLAACYRLVDLYGMSDMMANHISSHVPGERGAFLINPYGMMYEEITASSLIKVDNSGAILSTPDFGDLRYGINKAGYVIHSAVHAARPDVACVIHTHSWASMAVSSLECGLLPLTQTAMRFLKIGYHEYQGVVLDEKEQASLLADLGDREAVILRNHGALVVGRTGPTGSSSPVVRRSARWPATLRSGACRPRSSKRPGTTTNRARAGPMG
jgi:ribulose-5-phosphate 4-epimerase/fuculose-1-phosphate aldolase